MLRRKQTPRDKPKVKPEGSRQDTKKPKPTCRVWTGGGMGELPEPEGAELLAGGSRERVEGRPGARVAQGWWPRPSYLSWALNTHFTGRRLLF